MYFSVSDTPSLLYHQKLPSGHWLNTMFQSTTYGYQLDNHGGNYVNFFVDSDQLIVDFSYFKDFDLGSNSKQGVLLTNIESLIEQPLSPMVVQAQLNGSGLTTRLYNTRAWLEGQGQTVESTVTQLKECLQKNLKKCLDVSSTNWIVFTGGLDSSLLAFLAWHNQYFFNAVISEEFKNFWNLPFDVCYAELQNHPPGIEHNTIKSSFYQPEYNHSITGFFGDTTMLHHGSMYNQ
jgi:asparagine synthetase B (glutamine-hydrolysing)